MKGDTQLEMRRFREAKKHLAKVEKRHLGQAVKAKLTDSAKAENGMKLDKGTVLLGKVEQVQKSNDNGPAKLSVTFDQAKLKDGRTVPVKATLLAAYPPNGGN